MSDWYFEIYDPYGFPFRDRYKVKRGETFEVLEDEDVLARFDQTIDDEYDRPLLDRIRAATKVEKARLENEFTRGQVHRWQTGEIIPSEENVPKIKQILGIQEGELPDPDTRQVRDIAAVETLKFIRDCRRPAVDLLRRDMTPDLYRVLEFLSTHVFSCFVNRSTKREDVMCILAKEISTKFPDAGISGRDDLDELLSDWIGSFMILTEAINFRRST